MRINLEWERKDLYRRGLRDRDRPGLYRKTFSSGQLRCLEVKVNLRPGMIKRPCHLFYLLGLTNLDHHSENIATSTTLKNTMRTNSWNSFFQVLEMDGEGIWVTKSTASRAAKASMSAHETTPGHKASICDLASSITSNPLNPRFGKAFLSEEDPAINTEPSQPCKRTLMLWVHVDYWQYLYKHAKRGGEYIYIYIYTHTRTHT